jgi:hypothetical protein
MRGWDVRRQELFSYVNRERLIAGDIAARCTLGVPRIPPMTAD